MADRKALEFIQRAEQDVELHARVKAVRVDDKQQAFAELARIAESAGYAVTPDALEAALRECAPELSEHELDAVAGGTTVPCGSKSSLQSSAFFSFYTRPLIIPCV